MWSDKWLGLPYAELGRGPAYDCLGLFLAVQDQEFGRVLPDPLLHQTSGRVDLEALARGTWERVARAEPGCAFVFRWASWWHIGTAVDYRWMLSIETDAAGSMIADVTSPRFGSRLHGIYAYVG